MQTDIPLKEAYRIRAKDLLAILQAFAEGRYAARQLARVIPEKVVMASGLFEKALAKGRAEGRAAGRAEGRVQGRAEGRADEARQICVGVARTLHPGVAARVVPVIEGCSEPARLRRWTLRAARLSDAEFARLVTGRTAVSVTRSRTSRPSRASRRSVPARKGR